MPIDTLGATSRRWNTQHSNGWTGSTIAVCLNLSEKFPPAEAETNFYAAMETEDMAA